MNKPVSSLQMVAVPVSDQDRAKAFYVDVLGFVLRLDSPMGPEMRWVEVAPPAGETSLTLVTWFETMPAGSLRGLVIRCDDLEATYTELGRRGVRFHGPIAEQVWGEPGAVERRGRFATFDDPDGNGWVLTQGPEAEG